MKARELRGKSNEELQVELMQLRREAFNLRIQKGIGQTSRSSQIRFVRRNVARLKTVLNERHGT